MLTNLIPARNLIYCLIKGQELGEDGRGVSEGGVTLLAACGQTLSSQPPRDEVAPFTLTP